MKKQYGYAANTLIQIILFTGILLAINAIPRAVKNLNVFGTRIPLQKEFDLTQNKRFSLSDQTLKTLNRLQKPVKALAFTQQAGENSPTEQVLKRYAFASNNFSYEMVDLEKNPIRAAKYGVKTPNTLILESGDQKESVSLPFRGDAPGTEAKITSGLLRLLNPSKAVVYFVTGHGEMSLEPSSQASVGTLKTDLEAENYTVKPLELFSVTDIPADASVVVVAGPRSDFIDAELTTLGKYLDRGGRMLWMVGLDLSKRDIGRKPRLEKFLKGRGVVLGNDLVVSEHHLPVQSLDAVLIPAAMRYETNSPITQGFDLATFYLFAQSLKSDKPPEGGVVLPLVYTSPKTVEYAEPLKVAQRIVETQNYAVAFNPAKDKRGAAILALTATYPVKEPAVKEPSAAKTPSPSPSPGAPEEKKKEARMVVFGCSTFVNVGMLRISPGNRDLALNTIAWLSERTEQISVARPSETPRPVSLNEDQKAFLFRIGFPLMPCLVGLIGTLVYIFTRR
ncbi:MAG: hypothetical protein FJX76_18270 [Armatimonadetes bacterium]|nr:hypothetical protein [Armatimonadota bacterium]